MMQMQEILGSRYIGPIPSHTTQPSVYTTGTLEQNFMASMFLRGPSPPTPIPHNHAQHGQTQPLCTLQENNFKGPSLSGVFSPPLPHKQTTAWIDTTTVQTAGSRLSGPHVYKRCHPPTTQSVAA